MRRCFACRITVPETRLKPATVLGRLLARIYRRAYRGLKQGHTTMTEILCRRGTCAVRLTPREARHPFLQKDAAALLDTMRVGLRWARREQAHGTAPE